MNENRIMKFTVAALVLTNAGPIMGGISAIGGFETVSDRFVASLLQETPPRTFVQPIVVKEIIYHKIPAIIAKPPLFSVNEGLRGQQTAKRWPQDGQEHVFSGWFNGQAIRLGISNKKAKGFFGLHQIELAYNSSTRRIEGSYEGESLTLNVTPVKMNGKIGDEEINLSVE